MSKSARTDLGSIHARTKSGLKMVLAPLAAMSSPSVYVQSQVSEELKALEVQGSFMECKHLASLLHRKYLWKQHLSRTHNKKARPIVQRRRNEKQIYPKGTDTGKRTLRQPQRKRSKSQDLKWRIRSEALRKLLRWPADWHSHLV